MKHKKNNKSSKNGKKVKFSEKHPKISITIKLFLLAILLVIVVGAGIVVGMFYGMWGEDFEISEEELLVAGNSILYDSEGKVLAELKGDENRKVVKLEEMSKYLPKAYVAIEDERFYEHQGVDYKRTGGAIGTYILHKGSSSYGGSTITQQLVKNMTNEKAKTGKEGITRKIKEWAKAFKIEKMLSKDQILELYLNIIFVGDINYGVEVGAEYYFNKSAKDLSLEQCAFLAGINNRPNYYNPYGKAKYGKDETKTREINNRTKTVLGKMLELGYITQDEYNKATEKVDKGLKFKKGTKKGSVYSYHTDATISQVINDLMEEKGWSQDYATTYVYGGGLRIYSTQKTDVQKELEKTFEDNASTYQRKSRKNKDKDGNAVKSQAAMAVIDNETGYVVGVVGGLGKKDTARGLNRATQSPRPTGSSIKPIADVLPALQEGIINTSTMYIDSKTEFDNGKFKPKNDHNAYDGPITIRTAIAKSHNIPFVKIMAELTNPVARSYLQKMGISTLSETDDIGLALAIGGLHRGISPLEMAGAYATIANDGVYRTPLFYTKIDDDKGNTVFEPKQETREVCSKQIAYVVKDLLTSVVKGKGGTAPYCAISGMDVAAKTGTTNDDKDRWLCGFTNYYTGATWYGFDDPEEVHFDGNPAGKIWAATMKNLHADKKSSRFKEPDGIVSISVCDKTGLKATSKCKSKHTEIFAKDNVPEECDESGSSVEVCEDSGDLATEYCPNVIVEYYSYILPKERGKLWETHYSSGKVPTKKCKLHDEKTMMENAKAPKIKLNGKASITLKVGESYIEEGASATDSADGDISAQIRISGSVNTSKAGTYTITYKVKNSMGKETVKTRTITVKDNSSTVTPTPTKPTTPTEPTTPTTPTEPSTPTTPETPSKPDEKEENKTPETPTTPTDSGKDEEKNTSSDSGDSGNTSSTENKTEE